MPLYDYIKIKRRYTRSVNLERDLEIADSVNGYILTPKAASIIERFLKAISTPNSVRAWTITGVYGTGKSAFAHFLSSLCSSKDEKIRLNALKILKGSDNPYSKLTRNFPERGLIKAVVTSQREPIAKTIIRGLKRGVDSYWSGVRGVKPGVLKQLNALYDKVNRDKKVDNQLVLDLIQEIAIASKTGLLIIIDELGKNLEYAAQNQTMSDLYLLQQIAELPTGKQRPTILFMGLLHQAFSDYAHSLSSVQRNEWAKIQGRFEDIPFADSPERVMYLIGCAIDHSKSEMFTPLINNWSEQWNSSLSKYDFLNDVSVKELSSIYPLHPISAVSLPILCNKFSQNNRTLFTFLASDEPYSLTSFLKENSDNNGQLPTFKLHHLYDYFIESAGISMSTRPQFQRWIEVQGRIVDARYFDLDSVQVLKTVGILNLVSNTGSLRASRGLVSLAMCDNVYDKKELIHWRNVVDGLIKKSFITWRKQVDELRIWEGTDFNIEEEVSEQIQQIKEPLADLLNEFYPLRPLIARRHSYTTGTLRYFERIYYETIPDKIFSSSNNCDGVICYLINKKTPSEIPAYTDDGKPLIVICASEFEVLRLACHEYVGLKDIEKHAKQLQSDGVARRELKRRIFLAKKILDDTLTRSFDIIPNSLRVWILGKKEKINSNTTLNARLSDICDQVYSKGLHLWNELINRRELTSQGAKARRELIEAMLNNLEEERLGIIGNGPEFSIFNSVLSATGIYSYSGGRCSIGIPEKDSGVYHIWKEIESFCKSATETPKQISELYRILEAPPYGVKQGVIPILLLAVLLYYSDYISVYIDGTYIPILGSEHFELLVKRPEKFAVKYFEITGLRAKLFKELEEIISKPISHSSKHIRNITLLKIVTPLVRFIKKLPPYTLKTEGLSTEAKAVRKAILEAREPDTLLFVSLPQACGFPFINVDTSPENTFLKSFRKKLIYALQELQTSYDNLLSNCQKLLHDAFSVRSEISNLREDLRVRATYLKGQVIEPRLKSFIFAAINAEEDDRKWLESVLMVIADKPAESWTDNDVVLFETKLSDIARRFKNLEFIQKELASMPKEGFDAQKVTITYPDGEEINEVIWLEHGIKEKISKLAQEILNSENLKSNDKMKRALVAAMIQNIFCKETKESDIKQSRIERKKYA